MDVPAGMQLVFESFARNGRVNQATLATLAMSDLAHDDGAGGWNVGQHLADIVSFRRDWLTRVSPQHAERLPVVTGAASPTWLEVADIRELQAAFDAGDAAMRAAVLSAVSEGRSFERYYQSHPAHLLQHCVVHDSHHRGQILALLRRAGRPDPVRESLEDATWPIWRE